MARTRRIDLPASLYHVLSRTNTGDIAFRDECDRNKFLHYLAKYTEVFSFRVHAFCLMENHFHLLMESGDNPGLSELMRRLLTAYTIYFNRRHRRHGHLFQGRFKSLLVDKTSQMLALSRYIHLNPLAAGQTKAPEKFAGSSLRYYLEGGEPPYLHTAETLLWFGGEREKYAEFIREGLTQETKPAILQRRYVGDKEFVRRTEKRLAYLEQAGSRAALAEARRANSLLEEGERQATQWLKRVSGYFGVEPEVVRRGRRLRERHGKARTVLVYLLSEKTAWTSARIAGYLNLKEISGIYYHLKKSKQDADCRRAVKHLLNTKRFNYTVL